MLILLAGADSYRSKHQLRKMKEKFQKERDPQGLNIVILDAEKESLAVLHENIMSSPFLADKKMIIIENIIASKHTELQQFLLEKIENKTFPPTNIYIFWEREVKPRTKIGKALLAKLEQQPYSQKFDLLEANALNNWIKSYCEENNAMIEPQALHYLTQNTGPDMWQLHKTLDQAIAYSFQSTNPAQTLKINEVNTPSAKGGQGEGAVNNSAVKTTISLETIKLFTKQKFDDNIFNLIDAITRAQKGVFEMLSEQKRIGNDGFYILAMLIRQFRIMLQLSDLARRGNNLQSPQLAKELGLHPFVIKKTIPLLKNYTFEKLKKIHADLIDIDRQSKQGENIDLLIEKYIVSLSHQ